ncbi:MAG TPA: VWA domain-containing protein [Bryobacteraceae bacterium]|nr:VWA domain-containing protein [Bryobacteraceae bacterium]
MQRGILRASIATGLFALLVFEAVPVGALRAQAQSGQQNPQQKPPVTVPAGPSGEAKAPDQYSMSVEVPLVTLDVVVADEKGDIYTGLNKKNFRVSEDGVAQQVTNFSTPDAPITSVLLVEFGSRGVFGFPVYAANAVTWADEFLRQLKKDDWVALVSFDMRTRIEVDFTQDKMAVHNYLGSMVIPGFHESNVFDALMETVDNLKDVKGRKSVVLLASGIDTFSKHTLDAAFKRLKDTDVTVFPVGVAEALELYLEGHNMIGGAGRLNFYQADNQMKEFARLTGGYAFFPRFEGEIPGIMRSIAGMLRSQYSLGYVPTNQARDGKYRKIKVDVVGDDGQPVELKDKKGKNLKVVVYARQGYTAPKGPVS